MEKSFIFYCIKKISTIFAVSVENTDIAFTNVAKRLKKFDIMPLGLAKKIHNN